MSCRRAASISSRQTWDVLPTDWPQRSRSSPSTWKWERCHKSSWLARLSQSSAWCYKMHNRGSIKKRVSFSKRPVLELRAWLADAFVARWSKKKAKGLQSNPAPSEISSTFSEQKMEMNAAGCKKAAGPLQRNSFPAGNINLISLNHWHSSCRAAAHGPVGSLPAARAAACRLLHERHLPIYPSAIIFGWYKLEKAWTTVSITKVRHGSFTLFQFNSVFSFSMVSGKLLSCICSER